MSDLGRPAGTGTAGQSLAPAVQVVYWLDTALLPAGGPEPWRAAVVLAVPERADGTVAVVLRSGADDFGVAHGPDAALGMSMPGRFSRRRPVQGRLWTAAAVTLAGRLDDDTFAAVLERFGL